MNFINILQNLIEEYQLFSGVVLPFLSDLGYVGLGVFANLEEVNAKIIFLIALVTTLLIDLFIFISVRTFRGRAVWYCDHKILKSADLKTIILYLRYITKGKNLFILFLIRPLYGSKPLVALYSLYSDISAKKFFALNFIVALFWNSLFFGLGLIVGSQYLSESDSAFSVISNVILVFTIGLGFALLFICKIIYKNAKSPEFKRCIEQQQMKL